MNENKECVQFNKDVIDLGEFIMTIWKRKRVIISFTLIVAILAGVFSMFVLSPVYETKLNIVISIPEKYNTRYGEYTLPITSNEQYINLIFSNDVLINTMKDMGYSSKGISLEDIKETISIGNVAAGAVSMQNSFEVTVSAESPKESLKLAQSLFSNYLDFMDVMTKERAVSYYNNYYSIELKSLEDSLNSVKEILKKNEELLAQTPMVIKEGRANFEIQTHLNDSSDYIVPVNTINPNYIKIENDIIENKQSVNNIENSMRMYNKYLEELDIERKAINKYYRTGEAEKLESSIIAVIETNVYLPSPPVEPSIKSSPSNTINTVIGATIGVTLGVIVVLVQEFWLKRINKGSHFD